ncbi:MAG: magnesium/cobalt transporter CorA [Desulfatiglans sp.]|jgi:magnesium transporter|nr:magnesium/cobalt transporter CorA [Desulfatiglans sp.]
MSRFIKKSSKKAGLPPGALIHVGDKKAEEVSIRIIDYNEKDFEERDLSPVHETFSCKETSTVTWISVDGLHDVDIIQNIGEAFHLHPLVLEDVLNTGQRPKIDDFETYTFITLMMLFYVDEKWQIRSEQFSLILGDDYIISFQEKAGGIFDPVKKRIKNGKGRIRMRGADYLAYALIDAVVDNYFLVLEKIGERVDSLEERLMNDPQSEIAQEIHLLKRELIFLRKSVWPLREVISSLERGESDLFKKETEIYLRDIYDHTIQVIDTIETFRDMVSGMLDVYLSGISNRMNQVMKVLTVIATIFIPLTFVAGIYGMNFKYMPELEWPWSYPIVLIVMTVIVVIMLIWFRRKRFL